MPEPVKTRPYAGQRRRAEAARRRTRIIEAAAQLFAERGYAATAVIEVADRAGVAVDTVYEVVGRKAQLLIAAHDLILGDHAVDADGVPLGALQREYVVAVRAASGARAKIATYADALGRLLPMTAPLSEALREAGVTDAGCRALWTGMEERRAQNMRLFAADLRATGELREDLGDEEVADLVWSMNSASYYSALTRRGWDGARYAALVRDVWTRALLA